MAFADIPLINAVRGLSSPPARALVAAKPLTSKKAEVPTAIASIP